MDRLPIFFLLLIQVVVTQRNRKPFAFLKMDRMDRGYDDYSYYMDDVENGMDNGAYNDVDEGYSDQEYDEDHDQDEEEDQDLQIGFSFLSDQDVDRMAVCTINRPNYGEGEGELYDKRMGPRITGQDEDETLEDCVTCGLPSNNCIGHYGKIDLPIYVTINSKLVLCYLKCFCYTCHRFIVPPHEEQSTRQGIEDIKGFLCWVAKAYDTVVCHGCEIIQPKVKQVDDDNFSFCYWVKKTKTWTQITHGPVRIRSLLSEITNDELRRMLRIFEDNRLPIGNRLDEKERGKDRKNTVSRPEDLVIKTMLVPPNKCRPKKSCKDSEVVGDAASIIGGESLSGAGSVGTLSCDNALSGALLEILKGCTFIFNKQLSQTSSLGGSEEDNDEEPGPRGKKRPFEEEPASDPSTSWDSSSMPPPPMPGSKRKRRRLNVFGVSKSEVEREKKILTTDQDDFIDYYQDIADGVDADLLMMEDDDGKGKGKTTGKAKGKGKAMGPAGKTSGKTTGKVTATRGKDKCFFLKEFTDLRNKVRDFLGITPVSSTSSSFGGNAAGGLKRPEANVKTILDRKQGLFRNNVCGKRANVTGRTVITAGPFLKIGEVGIPNEMANHLKVLDFVNPLNKSALVREALMGGLEIIPDKGEDEDEDEDEDETNDAARAKQIINRCKRRKTLPDFFGTGVKNGGSVEDRCQKRKITILGENPELRRAMMSKRFFDVETGEDVPDFKLTVNHSFLYYVEDDKDLAELVPVMDVKTPWQEYLSAGDKVVDAEDNKVYQVRILDPKELNKELKEAEVEMREKTLKTGTRVLRNLRDGSIVHINRQPTLRRQSIQAMCVKLTKDSTIKLNPVQTPAFHADYDGDEMNVTVGSTFATAAEIAVLSGARKTLMSDEARKPSVVFIQDAILTAFVMTGGGTTQERGEKGRFMDVLMHVDGFWKRCGDYSQRMNQIESTVKAHLAKINAKIEAESEANANANANINAKTESAYKPVCPRWYPYDHRHLWSFVFPLDFFYTSPTVKIIDGILIEGTLDKKVLNDILTTIYTNYEESIACDVINDGQAITNAWQDRYGNSTSIEDCM